jgi:hypothetical protein
MSFVSKLKTKYQVVARDVEKKIKDDIQSFIKLEQKEFVVDDEHLSLEKRKELINARKKELERKSAEIEKDIDNDPNLTDKEKEQDKTRLESHLEHYEKGLDSMANAKAWRDLDEVSPEEWKKKGLDPKGDKLGSSRPGGIASFAIPAGLTCPKAGSCKNHCFALTGHTAYVQMVRDTHSAALGLAERDDFVTKMNEVIGKKFKGKTLDPKNPYRIHAWGDFYSNKYANKWMEIIKSNPNVWFYAYTKSFTMPAVKELMNGIKKGKIKNAKIIQSVNGKDDKNIDSTQPIAVVFKSKSDMDAWNSGKNTIVADNYSKQKAKRLVELQNEIATKDKTDKKEMSKDERYDVAVLKKELRKLKKEKPEEREQAYARLVNLLDNLGVKAKDSKFVECSDNDLVAADPKNKRIGIVEHGELHQPRGYKIDEVEAPITAASFDFDAPQLQNVRCEHMHGV